MPRVPFKQRFNVRLALQGWFLEQPLKHGNDNRGKQKLWAALVCPERLISGNPKVPSRLYSGNFELKKQCPSKFSETPQTTYLIYLLPKMHQKYICLKNTCLSWKINLWLRVSNSFDFYQVRGPCVQWEFLKMKGPQNQPFSYWKSAVKRAAQNKRYKMVYNGLEKFNINLILPLKLPSQKAKHNSHIGSAGSI